MKNCETCAHSLEPQGGWCYMFREEPISVSCAKHTTHTTAAADWSLSSFLSRDSLINTLTPSPDTALKLVNIGLDAYRATTNTIVDTASSVYETAGDVATTGLTLAGDAATAGIDAVVAVGSGAADMASGIASGVGEIAGSLTDL